jgi:hypothetical protein
MKAHAADREAPTTSYHNAPYYNYCYCYYYLKIAVAVVKVISNSSSSIAASSTNGLTPKYARTAN